MIPMACMDTNFLIHMWNGDPGIRELMERLERDGDEAKTTMMNIAEMYHGAHRTKNHRYMKWIAKLERRFQVLGFDAKSAYSFGVLSSSISADKLKAHAIDVIVASIAIANGERVITRDKDFAGFPGIRTIRW